MWSSKSLPRRRSGPAGIERDIGAVATFRVLLAAGLLSACCVVDATSAAGLADIDAEPLRDQTAEQMRRDRYECHNWAVEQVGQVPEPSRPSAEEQRARRGERIGKVILGAGVGATLGGLIRGADDRRDANAGALGGAVLGAAAGAVAGRKKDPTEAEDEVFDAYFRALSACMEGRGYGLVVNKAGTSP